MKWNGDLLDNVLTPFEHDGDANDPSVFQPNSETKFSDCFDWSPYSIEIAIVSILVMIGCPLGLYILLLAIISSIWSETKGQLIYHGELIVQH